MAGIGRSCSGSCGRTRERYVGDRDHAGSRRLACHLPGEWEAMVDDAKSNQPRWENNDSNSQIRRSRRTDSDPDSGVAAAVADLWSEYWSTPTAFPPNTTFVFTSNA